MTCCLLAEVDVVDEDASERQRNDITDHPVNGCFLEPAHSLSPYETSIHQTASLARVYDVRIDSR